MQKLDRSTIKKLTKLSRIQCSEEEQEILLKELEQIVGYIEQLQEVNTDDVLPCNHVLSYIANVMRDDIVCSTMPRELFLANAPAQIGGMIRVPPVIKTH
jgi:aspartyl-tRNA(Asn)/glutamyl-tRNA(Gln) amidotransferase subunit C